MVSSEKKNLYFATEHFIPRWRIVGVLLFVSLLPLCLVGLGSWIVFGGLLDRKSLDLQNTIIEDHAKTIDLYLSERIHALQFVADLYSLLQLSDGSILKNILTDLNIGYNNAFVDIGIINQDGEHVQYIGPFNLIDKNYKDTEWFRLVQTQGVYVSDVFLGFRQVPHFIIAIKKHDTAGFWILRVTINSEQFDAIVHTQYLGKTGDAFIINRSGVFQTSPKFGKIMEQSQINILQIHPGVQNKRTEVHGTTKIQATTWLNNNRWMLVVQQDESEIRTPIRQAMLNGILVISLAMVLVTVTTVLATRHLNKQIDLANQKRDEMQNAFMRSAKLAAIGEMATGLAHEINNPLAIISSEQTNINDLILEMDSTDSNLLEMRQSVERSKRQIDRCGNITQKMLQFGRRSDSRVQETDIVQQLQETVNLMQKQAQVRNIDLHLQAENGLPAVLVNPIELEQVLVNMINNAFYAINRDGSITIMGLQDQSNVLIKIQDSGCGIENKDLVRIFEPFYTTKPVGQGTGLGLSVCYGIIHSWGGKIDVESESGKGTIFTIRLPICEKLEK